jgi:hypothetical protein
MSGLSYPLFPSQSRLPVHAIGRESKQTSLTVRQSRHHQLNRAVGKRLIPRIICGSKTAGKAMASLN